MKLLVTQNPVGKLIVMGWLGAFVGAVLIKRWYEKPWFS